MSQLFHLNESANRSDCSKLSIIDYLIQNGNSTTADMARVIGVSMPTAAKLISELCDDGYVNEYGKLETDEGRRPQLYGINPSSAYFLGIDFDKDVVNIGLIDFCGSLVELQLDKPFKQENTMENLDELCKLINNFIDNIEIPREKIQLMNVNISGRVNTDTGYSYSMYNFSEEPVASLFTQKVGITTTIENDSRAMGYGEYISSNLRGYSNVLFFNVSWGLGMSIIIDGEPYKGKSGFAGELGHVHAFDNEIICQCGKKGCLETEASGSAFYRIVRERLAAGEASTVKRDANGDFTLKDLIEATNNEDWLCIDVVESIGLKLGQHIAGLINIFNPELVVLGGSMSAVGDYLLQSVRSAVIKYSLSLIYKDTKIVLSNLKDRVGVVGSCMIARKNALKE